MRCKTCDYRLWNIPARRCPECGTPFKPSEFEFVPNSIKFCCPHCGQAYYGTSSRGHLVPAAFPCVSCSRPIHMDDTVLLPAEGLIEERTAPVHVPWVERRNRGLLRVWFATVSMAMVAPTQLMRALPRYLPGTTGTGFALATLIPAWVIGMSFPCGLPIIMAFFLGRRGTGGAVFLPILLVPLAVAIACPIVLLLWAGLTHGVLRLLKGTSARFHRTWQAMSFSAGAGVWMAIPCLGPYFGWIWWIVSAILMVREGHRTSGVKATAAVLTLPILTIGGFGIFYAVMMYFVVSQVSTAATTFPTSMPGRPFIGEITVETGMQETAVVLKALRAYAANHDGRGPSHAIELYARNYLDSADPAAKNSLRGSISAGRSER
ncbi:MAG TPA: hypothetical protein VLM89_14130, partial [Phycisphaerae bacterium]|nr:hypothetical protein [Phycisphaerae bacterium]